MAKPEKIGKIAKPALALPILLSGHKLPDWWVMADVQGKPRRFFP